MNPFKARIPVWTESLIIISLIILKFWMVNGQEVEAVFSPVDDSMFVKLADEGFWSTPYDALVFSKQPGYPLFLSLVKASGIPYRLIIEVLLVLSSLYFCLCLKKWKVPLGIRLLIFAGMVFHPATIELHNRILRDAFYTYLIIILLGQCISLLHPDHARKPWHFVMPGLIAAITWLTREESLITLIILCGLGFGLLLQNLNQLRSIHHKWKAILLNGAVLFLPIMLLNLLACSLSLYHRGVFITCESKDGAAEHAYRQLLRIKPETSYDNISLTREALKKAYEASETFAKIRKPMEEVSAPNWAKASYFMSHVEGEMGGNNFTWAIREAMGIAGFHDNANKAHEFYEQVGQELEAAFEAGELESRFTWHSIMDPDLGRVLSDLPGSMKQSIGRAYGPIDVGHRWLRLPRYGRKETLALYDRVTHRRHYLAYETTPIASGWIWISNDTITRLEVNAKNDKELDVCRHFTERRDVAEAFRDDAAPIRCGFRLSLPMLWHPKTPSHVDIHTESGELISIPATRFTETGIQAITTDSGETLRFSVDRFQKPDLEYASQLNMIEMLRLHYGDLLLAVSLLALILLIVRLVLFKWNSEHWYSWISCAFVAGVGLLIFLLGSVVNVAAFQIHYRVLYPLFLLLPGIVLWTAWLSIGDMRMRYLRFFLGKPSKTSSVTASDDAHSES